MNCYSTENSDNSDIDEAFSFARQFDQTDTSSVLKSDQSTKEENESENESDSSDKEHSDNDDDHVRVNNDEDSDDNDDDEDDDVDEDSDLYDSDGSLIQDQAALTNEIDLNNLPERMNERIFQLLGDKGCQFYFQ
jgi:hypothetical protein